jgi:ethylbenzene hydroxylase subunit beta/complex iron-sulfur molybdoenzyme family reductase subunit beta
VKQHRVALPLHPEFNTGPNVYYVPPLAPSALDEQGNFDDSRPRIPIEYLRELFGPKVDAALERLRAELAKRREEPKQPSELMELLIARRWQEVLGPFTGDPREVQA